ncbi:transglycosylase SLT domain-containing protein [Streptomyces sp. URMC 123]|uniref:transglycosylase SLT domain-containing protein n=1 Tax=Streptomyces sp. URMC 123 TaxID=3423403 RepID=UPI003F1BAC8B
MLSGYTRLNRTHKLSVAGIAAAGAAALAFAVVPGPAEAEVGAQALSAKPVAWNAGETGAEQQQDIVSQQSARAAEQAKTEAEAKRKADEEAKKKADAEAKAKADRERAEAASRSAQRSEPAPAAKSYPNNLDGWIREALDVMKAKGIPGSYDGIKRNIIRESGGNPRAINLWDINAKNGIPSKGLLQVIDPTFKAYHVEGTSWDIYDPVANITAACNYAAARYGSMDNVNSAY